MSGGDEERLRIVLDQLARLSGMPPPPAITPDQLATGQSAISQLLRVLGIAANGGDPGDNLAALAGHDEREAKAADALAKFPANEEQSSARLAGVGGQSEMTQMLQQMPQMAAGIAGGISGALGGALQPLSQIPQQLAQAGQQAMQMGMGALQHGVGGATPGSEAIPAELEASGGGEEFGGGGSPGGGGGGIGPTTPTAMLTPLPGSSAGTLPASSHTTSPAPPPAARPPTAPQGGMGAMPIMPPGMAGAGPGNDTKAETKRVLVPSVKNGAPVQGRITTPPPTPEVIKRVDGKPVATRRILLPEHKRDDADSGR
jgi:hypothetical protein